MHHLRHRGAVAVHTCTSTRVDVNKRCAYSRDQLVAGETHSICKASVRSIVVAPPFPNLAHPALWREIVVLHLLRATVSSRAQILVQKLQTILAACHACLPYPDLAMRIGTQRVGAECPHSMYSNIVQLNHAHTEMKLAHIHTHHTYMFFATSQELTPTAVAQ